MKQFPNTDEGEMQAALIASQSDAPAPVFGARLLDDYCGFAREGPKSARPDMAIALYAFYEFASDSEEGGYEELLEMLAPLVPKKASSGVAAAVVSAVVSAVRRERADSLGRLAAGYTISGECPGEAVVLLVEDIVEIPHNFFMKAGGGVVGGREAHQRWAGPARSESRAFDVARRSKWLGLQRGDLGAAA